MGKIVAIAALLALGGCAGTSASEAMKALAADPNSACIHVENSYPPFANKFTIVRTGNSGTTVAVNSDCAITTPAAVVK